MFSSPNSSRNHLLIALSPDDRGMLEPFLELVDLKLYDDLEKPSTPIENVYFMESGIASVVAVSERDNRIEIGLIGREGMTGSAVVLDGGSSLASERDRDCNARSGDCVGPISVVLNKPSVPRHGRNPLKESTAGAPKGPQNQSEPRPIRFLAPIRL